MKHLTRRLTLITAGLLSCAMLTACANTSRVPAIDDLAGSTTKATTTTAATTAASVEINDTKYDVENFTFSDHLDENGHFDGVVAQDHVTLPDYSAISIPADVHTITDEAVQEQLDTIRDNAMYYEQLTDKIIEDGDTVNIDYVGSIDGVEFEGGSTGGNGTTVTIGVTSYIDDFLEQLIGHKPGETVNVEVTFPDEYQNEDLEGKDAVFVTVINYVQGEEIYPEINDAFVAENYGEGYGMTTVEELKTTIRDGLQTQAVSAYIEEYLIENSEFKSVPEALYDYQAETMLYNCEVTAASYGIDLGMYLNYLVGVETVSQMLEQQAESLDHYSRLYLVMQAIAEDKGLTADDAMLETYFADLKTSGVYDSYAEFYGAPYMKFVALNDTVMTQLMDSAVLAE